MTPVSTASPTRSEKAVEEPKTRILVVDDEESILDFVEMGLTHQGFEVARAKSGTSALQLFAEFAPHAIILDVMLPDRDGIEVCMAVRAISTVPILMLTAKGGLEDRVRGLDSGADDYLSKPFKFKELMARMRALLRRAGFGTGHTLTFGDLTLDRSTRRLTRLNRPIDLTSREYELLELLMQRPRHVFTREQILNRLWGYEFDGETNVVEVHVRALRTKLGDNERRLIRAVRGVGYTLGG
jgi:DNA-binding response OmpR family regulator